MTDAELRAQTDDVQGAAADGETLDDLLPEAFAVVREAAKRTLGQRHFDVQIMGGAALHLGNIAEMKTGEGKTLVGDAAGVPQRARRQGRPRRHRQRLPRQARRRVDGPGPPLPRPDRRRDPRRRCRRPSAARRTRATSPTAPTTSSASTTCATTWPGADDELVQRGHNFAHRRRGRLDPHRRGPDPADHQRSGRPERTKWYAEFARHRADAAREDVDYEVDEKKRTVGDHSRPASRRSRTSSASTTSTRPSTRRSSATSTTRSRPRSSTSATRTTSS